MGPRERPFFMDAVLLGEALETEFVLVDFENVQPKDLATTRGVLKITDGKFQYDLP
jgi:hypothetical protein